MATSRQLLTSRKEKSAEWVYSFRHVTHVLFLKRRRRRKRRERERETVLNIVANRLPLSNPGIA